MMFTELWGTEYTNFHVPGFQYFNLNRHEYTPNSKWASGGIIIYLKESILKPNYNVMLMKDNDDIIWLRFDETKSIVSDCLYVCLWFNMSKV